MFINLFFAYKLLNENNMAMSILYTLPFSLGAIYHLLCLIFPRFGEPSPTERHLVFILINLAFIFLAIKKRPWFRWAMVILLIQQLYSHGSYGIEVFAKENRIDYISLFICFGLPIYVFWVWKYKKT